MSNPFKGWRPDTDAGPIGQPCAMVYHDASRRELEPTEGQYRFAEWEQRAWDVPEGRGKQVVFHIDLDHPGKPSGVPDWLRTRIKLTPHRDHGGGQSPDSDLRPARLADHHGSHVGHRCCLLDYCSPWRGCVGNVSRMIRQAPSIRLRTKTSRLKSSLVEPSRIIRSTEPTGWWVRTIAISPSISSQPAGGLVGENLYRAIFQAPTASLGQTNRS